MRRLIPLSYTKRLHVKRLSMPITTCGNRARRHVGITQNGELPEIAAHRAALGSCRGLPHVPEHARRRGGFVFAAAGTAFALSELASSQGNHAVHSTPGFLTSQLGASQPAAALVRKPAPHVTVRIATDGLAVSAARRSRSARRYDVVAQELDIARQRCQPQDRLRHSGHRLRREAPGRGGVPRRRQAAGHSHLALASRHHPDPADDPAGSSASPTVTGSPTRTSRP